MMKEMCSTLASAILIECFKRKSVALALLLLLVIICEHLVEIESTWSFYWFSKHALLCEVF